MNARIWYWTLGDSHVYRDVQVETKSDLQVEIDKLVDDPREPLAQLDRVEEI